MLDKKFKYRAKNAHEIMVSEMMVRLWSFDGPADRNEISKIMYALATTGFVYPYVALMPDWHPGNEAAIVGSVIPTRSVLLPDMIGGDIGCGMIAVRLPVYKSELSNKFRNIAKRLHLGIPTGSAFNTLVTERVESNHVWLKELKAPVSNRTLRKLIRQFASLGGGNHFLEIQHDQEEFLWIMLHSGSRYLGVQVRDWYIEQGAKINGIDKKTYSRIPYLHSDSEIASEYLSDMETVLEFARESRKEMMIRALEVLKEIVVNLDIDNLLENAIEVNHNCISRESYFNEDLYIHRKGAIHLPKGARGLVPGSMGTHSYIVEGKGNEFAFCSCAHGSGRAMSRAEARRKITQESYRESMKHVESFSSEIFIDEAPAAY